MKREKRIRGRRDSVEIQKVASQKRERGRTHGRTTTRVLLRGAHAQSGTVSLPVPPPWPIASDRSHRAMKPPPRAPYAFLRSLRRRSSVPVSRASASARENERDRGVASACPCTGHRPRGVREASASRFVSEMSRGRRVEEEGKEREREKENKNWGPRRERDHDGRGKRYVLIVPSPENFGRRMHRRPIAAPGEKWVRLLQ